MPILRLDGALAGIVGDVAIETEHAMWSLVAAASSSQLFEANDGEPGGMVSRIIDARCFAC
jgi:hypothetical protein